jgi:hypothetical protein
MTTTAAHDTLPASDRSLAMRSACLFFALLLAPAPAAASSSDAWAEFRAKVETACRALVNQPGTVTVEVNPFGSESYGAAILTIAHDGVSERLVCIFDKVTEAAELTVPFVAGPTEAEAIDN